MGDVIVLVVLGALVGGIIYSMIREKKNGKNSGCSCGCSGCTRRENCQSKTKEMS